MDAVELHPWAATVDDLENPDHLVFDLDPGPGVEWEFVIETALKLETTARDRYTSLRRQRGAPSAFTSPRHDSAQKLPFAAQGGTDQASNVKFPLPTRDRPHMA